MHVWCDEERTQKGFSDKISITPPEKRRLKETYFLCEYLPYCHNIVAPQPKGWQRGAEEVSFIEPSKNKLGNTYFIRKFPLHSTSSSNCTKISSI